MTFLEPITPDPGMGSIASEQLELVNELRAAGVPATADPDLVLAMVAETGVGALVGPPEAQMPYLSGAELNTDVPVHLVGNPPGGWAQWVPVWAAQPAAMRVTDSPGRPVALTIGSQTLPGVRFTAARTFHAPELDPTP